jgi:hypothetical protein
MKDLSVPTITEKNKTESAGILIFVDIYLDSGALHFVHNDINVAFFDPDGAVTTYNALKMVREKRQESMDLKIQTLVAGLDNVDQAMSVYIASQDFRDRRIVIRGCFRNLLDDVDNAWLIFDGFMDKPQFSKAEFRVELVPRLGRGSIAVNLGIKQQLLCILPFAETAGLDCAYDIAPATLKDTKTAQTVDSGATGYIIDAARIEADDYWNFGYVTFANDTLTTALRGIVRQIKDFIAADDKVLFAIALPAAPQAGDTYSIERGCDHTLDSCMNKFSNQNNILAITTLPALMVRK